MVSYEYVPPSNHRANKAERAIRTAKNHIISAIAGTHPSFPLYLWDELLPQCEITLNHLRPSKDNNLLSAYDGLFKDRPYDFMAHPMGPPGTLVLAFDSPGKRGSWDPHGTRCYYLGPALDHYRVYNLYVINTRGTRQSDTLAWFPDKVIMPGARVSERILASIQDLQECLSEIQTTDSIETHARPTFQDHSGSAVAALRHLHDIYFKQPTQPQQNTEQHEHIERVKGQAKQEDIPTPAIQRVEENQPQKDDIPDTRPIISKLPTTFSQHICGTQHPHDCSHIPPKTLSTDSQTPLLRQPSYASTTRGLRHPQVHNPTRTPPRA